MPPPGKAGSPTLPPPALPCCRRQERRRSRSDTIAFLRPATNPARPPSTSAEVVKPPPLCKTHKSRMNTGDSQPPPSAFNYPQLATINSWMTHRTPSPHRTSAQRSHRPSEVRSLDLEKTFQTRSPDLSHSFSSASIQKWGTPYPSRSTSSSTASDPMGFLAKWYKLNASNANITTLTQSLYSGLVCGKAGSVVCVTSW